MRTWALVIAAVAFAGLLCAAAWLGMQYGESKWEAKYTALVTQYQVAEEKSLAMATAAQQQADAATARQLANLQEQTRAAGVAIDAAAATEDQKRDAVKAAVRQEAKQDESVAVWSRSRLPDGVRRVLAGAGHGTANGEDRHGHPNAVRAAASGPDGAL